MRLKIDSQTCNGKYLHFSNLDINRAAGSTHPVALQLLYWTRDIRSPRDSREY